LTEYKSNVNYLIAFN